jgi:hypothetical protein
MPDAVFQSPPFATTVGIRPDRSFRGSSCPADDGTCKPNSSYVAALSDSPHDTIYRNEKGPPLMFQERP